MIFGKNNKVSQSGKDRVNWIPNKTTLMIQNQWYTGSTMTLIYTKFTSKVHMKWVTFCGQNNRTKFYKRLIETCRNILMISNVYLMKKHQNISFPESGSWRLIFLRNLRRLSANISNNKVNDFYFFVSIFYI